MSVIKFCGFDYTNRDGNAVNLSTTYAPGGIFDFALDSGMLLQSFGNDAVSYAPGFGAGIVNSGSQGRNASDGGAMGYSFAGGGLTSLNILGSYTQGVTCTRATLGNPSELWITMDVNYGVFGGNVDSPATLQRSESRFQIFKWGDLSLRMRRIFNYATSPTRADFTFELFNATTSLGTITVPAFQQGNWMYIRIHALLSATGAFDVSIDGIPLVNAGINTVSVTPLASATQLWFSGGALGVVIGSDPGASGGIDNLYIDNAAFPTGRPTGRRVSIASDNTMTGFAATAGGTVTAAAAAVDSNFVRGTGVGSSALFNLSAISTTGLQTNLIGWQLLPCIVSNVDPLNAKKLAVGMSLSGTPYMDTAVAAQTPPLAPSYISPGLGSVYFKGGTTPFTLTDIPNLNPRIQVNAV